MSETSPALSMPYLMPSQAQKHVTHNEALEILDALVQLTVQEFGAQTPPAAPAAGETHALGSGAAGAWAGQDGMLAVWRNSAWVFVSPRPGWRAWGLAASELRVWTGSAWEMPVPQTQNLGPVGIGTAADAGNPLTVAADASLFTHSGQGHQVKVNKASAADTAAFLFQSGWTGHAEIGLLGSDDFALKVSSDGSSWRQPLTVKADTGRAGFGTSAPDAHLEIEGGDTTVMALTASGSGQDYLQAGDGSSLAFRFDDAGNGSCAGAWSGGGADYAEYFEWADGNPDREDRRGEPVVFEGDKIRPARAGEVPTGVISAAPCLVGNDDLGVWQGRYLRDAFGAYLRDADGSRAENPAYDPAQDYIARKDRAEWACVGLLGRLRMRPGRPAAPGWIRLAGREGGVEEWLVR